RDQHVCPELVDAAHTGEVLGITVSPDGKLITTNSLDGDIRVWAADTGRPIYRVRYPWANQTSVVFFPDSKSFVSVGEDRVTPIVRDAATGQEVRRFAVPSVVANKETTTDPQLSPDGKVLTTSANPTNGREKSFSVRWDVATGQVIDRTQLA